MAHKDLKVIKGVTEKDKTFSDIKIKNQRIQKEVTSEYLPKPRVKEKEKEKEKGKEKK